MKNLLTYSFFILVCCLTACKKEVVPAVDKENRIAQGDTIHNIHQSDYVEALAEKKDTLFTIDDKQYTLECSTVMDTFKKVSYTMFSTTKDGKVKRSDYIGYSISYHISLRETNGKTLFSKTFTKKDFEGVVGKDALAQAISELPVFYGYHPGFKALLFTLDFMRPETDIGDQCFFMIGMDGKVIEKSYNNSYGGGGPDGTIEVPRNSKFVVTCAKILNTNGKVIDLSEKGKSLAHVKLINDKTILVVYDTGEENPKDNARLIDNNGKVHKAFTYKGYYDMLGYVVPSYFEKITGTYILLDEQLSNIRILPTANPMATFIVPFEKLKNIDANPDNEVTFDINTETSEQTFAMDTVTKAIRIIKQVN